MTRTRISSGSEPGSMNMALNTSPCAARKIRKPTKAITANLNSSLEELDLSLNAEQPPPARKDGYARKIGLNAIEHDLRRILQQGRGYAGDGDDQNDRNRAAAQHPDLSHGTAE